MPAGQPAAAPGADAFPRLSIRLDLGDGARIGPGKVRLLEEIDRNGSISAAGRVLKMSYRRAWQLVEDLNRGMDTPVVETATGGSGGGGARLTPTGRAVVDAYRAIEAAANGAATDRLEALLRCRAGGQAPA